MDSKRLADILLAFILTFTFVWFLPFVALLIKSNSAGPVFFKQTRVGKNKILFVCIKLRTMYTGTEVSATHLASASSITSVGKFLRQSKIDELPQIWNVLRGEMSFIGPRPCLPLQLDVIEERYKRGVLHAMPGISGLAQVNKVTMSNPRRLAAYDALYVRRRSLCLDIYLIYKTIALSLRFFGKRNS